MKSIRAVVERPELWKVFINGNEVTKTEGSYWIEKSFPQFFLKISGMYGKSIIHKILCL